MKNNRIILKVILTTFISLLLLIPLAMVSKLVSEREGRRHKAKHEVSNKWGTQQNITGPILVIPYKQYYKDKKNIQRERIDTAYFLPENLIIDGTIIPEKRSRGLYKVVLYKLKGLSFKGHFTSPEFRTLHISKRNVMWKRAYIIVGIPDTRGIQKSVKLNWNKEKLTFLPGVQNTYVLSNDIHTPVSSYSLNQKKIPFSFKLDIRGSNTLSFAPMGKETNIFLKSTWKHPSFFGSFLPNKRAINDKGFYARWKVSYFGRNYPQQWVQKTGPGSRALTSSSFGVKMYQPVDFYQKTTRAVKYGFLFIGLTFITFFLFEVFTGLDIHPLQYAFIGISMVLFYLLFLSLSEHMNFIISYTISACAVITLITAYCFKVLKQNKRSITMGSLITGLYVYLFILLENEDYTLLLGSVALFVILAVIMYITRNIDWYNIGIGKENKDQIDVKAQL
jgi:inner membrane protein